MRKTALRQFIERIREQEPEPALEPAEEFLNEWANLYQKEMSLRYSKGDRIYQLQLADDIIEIYGNNASRAAKALLTHEELRWVSVKTLEWLANEKNSVYVAPHLKNKTVNDEYGKERSKDFGLTIRRRGNSSL